MRTVLRTIVIAVALLGFGLGPLAAQEPGRDQKYSPNELVNAGHQFFGTISQGLATVIEKAISTWGQPNGYILGQEAGAPGGLAALWRRHALHQERRRLAGLLAGPSVGFRLGGDGACTMMLVYNLPRTDAVYQRFAGIDGLPISSAGSA